MFIGGVAGLALGRALELVGISPALGLDTMIIQHVGRSGAPWASIISTGLPLVVLSALLATVPDIDEPNSYIARRAEAVVTLTGAGLVGFAAYTAKLSPAMMLIALILGTIVGGITGHIALRAIRRAAGGHRRFTHSLVLAAALALVAGGLWLAHLGAWTLIPAALAWGIVVHDLGDLVTPAGLPLFYPFSDRTVRVLPKSIARFGEPLVALAASVAGLLLLGVLHF